MGCIPMSDDVLGRPVLGEVGEVEWRPFVAMSSLKAMVERDVVREPACPHPCPGDTPDPWALKGLITDVITKGKLSKCSNLS